MGEVNGLCQRLLESKAGEEAMKETPPKCVRVRALKLTLTLRGPLAIAPNCGILRLELSIPRGLVS